VTRADRTRASALPPVPRLAEHPPAEVLRRLELAVTRRLDGLLHGDYRGLVPGHGSEAGEARPYVAGDDVRRIDWNVTARMRNGAVAEPHIRETIADRELETWLVVDLSPSLDFGTAQCTKRELAVAGTAAVAFLTGRLGNRLGAVILGGPTDRVVPARAGRVHLRAVLHQAITAPQGSRPAELSVALKRLTRPGHRRGLVVVVSDFLDGSDWQRAMRAVTSRHDVLAIEVVDPRELELPDVGVLSLVDVESGARREVRTSRKLRARYSAAAADQRAAIRDALRAAGADHLQLRTDHDWLLELVRFVQMRRLRVDHLRRSRA
jgi:uncharacterized protein (DUF58 family)